MLFGIVGLLVDLGVLADLRVILGFVWGAFWGVLGC